MRSCWRDEPPRILCDLGWNRENSKRQRQIRENIGVYGRRFLDGSHAWFLRANLNSFRVFSIITGRLTVTDVSAAQAAVRQKSDGIARRPRISAGPFPFVEFVLFVVDIRLASQFGKSSWNSERIQPRIRRI